MARASVGEVLGKLKVMQDLVAGGMKKGAACKIAKVSPGTYKKWVDAYSSFDLPTFVRPRPINGICLFTPDGSQLVVISKVGDDFELLSLEVKSGKALAQAALRSNGAKWNCISAASIDATGSQVLMLLDDGGLHRWNIDSGAVIASAHDLRGKGLPLGNRSSSSAGSARWSIAAISHDLALVAYWEQNRAPASNVLHVMRVADGAEVLRHESNSDSIPSPILFNPWAPLVAIYDLNKLIVILDIEQKKPVVARGPQVHAMSFSSADQLMYSDWYSKTKELDIRTGESKLLAPGDGVQASGGGRYLTLSPLITLRNKSNRRTIGLPLERDRLDCVLSLDGKCLAVQSDVLSVWTFP